MNSKSLREGLELANIARKLVPKKNSRVSETGKNQESLVYRQISDSETPLSDQDIIQGHGLSRRRYQQILSEINHWLFEQILERTLPATLYSDYSRRLFALDRAHATLRILGRLGLSFSASEEAKHWFEESIVLEEWQVAISLLDPLLTWASLSGDLETYNRLISERPRLVLLEATLADATEVIQRVRMVFAKSGAEHPELLEIIRPVIARLELIVREHGTFRLNELLLVIRRMAQQVTMDYDDALAICEDMDGLLQQFPLFANRARKSRNAVAKLMCLVQRKKHSEALSVAESQPDLFDTGDQNWYSFQAWRFLLFLHTQQFSKGYELAREVMSHSLFSSQTAVTRELWNLFLRYAELMTGRPITGVTFRKSDMPGDLHRRIMKQFSSFKGDYSGYEMAAVVLEILIILEKRLGDLASRIDSLKIYKSRHLTGDQETQSGIFISIVQLLNTYDLDRAKIVTASVPMLELMSTIKTIDRVQSQQVLPYETLWQLIEERLPKNAAEFYGKPELAKVHYNRELRLAKVSRSGSFP